MVEKSFESAELKLCALILAETPESRFEISPVQKTFYITFTIFYPTSSHEVLSEIVKAYLAKTARVDLFLYNNRLRQLRQAIEMRRKND